MKWYENQVFIGTLALTLIACCVIFFAPASIEKVVTPIVTGISGFISGAGGMIIRQQRKDDANAEKIK